MMCLHVNNKKNCLVLLFKTLGIETMGRPPSVHVAIIVMKSEHRSFVLTRRNAD